MPIEIERKFLVVSDFKHLATSQIQINQGFISSVPERTVRVRIIGDKGYLTIKGIATDSGVSRFEWEKEIPLNEAYELLLICEPGKIEKIRYYIPVDNHIFEVDEFLGENLGLTIAEIELKSVEEIFSKPIWLGEEVTGNNRYYNSMLAKHPFNKW